MHNDLFRETIQRTAAGERKYIRFLEGRGHFAHLLLQLTPTPGQPCAIVSSPSLPIPEDCRQAAHATLQQRLQQGPLHGLPFYGFELRLTGGTFRPPYSNPEAFSAVAAMAFDEVLREAHPLLIERWTGIILNVTPYALAAVLSEITTLLGKVNIEITQRSHFKLRLPVPVRLIDIFRTAFAVRNIETFPLPVAERYRPALNPPFSANAPKRGYEDFT